MSPPSAKASLAERAAESRKVGPASRARPNPSLPSRLGNEQMLTLLREKQARASGNGIREANGDVPATDSWSTLSAAGRSRAAALFEKCLRLIGELNDAQAANVSTLRAEWINTLVNVMLVQINDLDADGQIPFVERAFDDYAMQIANRVADFGSEWAALERRYIEERDWLLFQKADEATFAANRLDELYTEARARINGPAAPYVTDQDFGALKQAMNTRSHVALGELQVSRNRARDVHELLDVVRELRVDGQDLEKFAPGWLGLVNNELASLERLARRARTAPSSDLSTQYLRLRDDLRKERDEALQGIAAQKAREAIDNLPMNRVPIAAAKMIVGAADAIVSPIIETARELYDEAQIGLYYVSGGRYQVKLTSSLMDAFAHGATRTEVLKGMVDGLVGTPGRLLAAAETGNWEAVGKEAMNLYLLAKTIEGSPGYIRRAAQILATTRRALRVVRARTLVLRLRAPRLLPEAPLPPREPVFLRHDAAGRPVAGARPQATPTPRSSLPAEPTFLKHPPGSHPAWAEFRDLFLRQFDAKEPGSIMIEGVGMSGIRVVLTGDGELTVFYTHIKNFGRTPGHGRLMHTAFEEAAKAVGALRGAKTVRVAVELVQNPDWAAHLESLGYERMMIQTGPIQFTTVYLRLWKL